MKKWLCLLLGMVMTMGLLAGCSGKLAQAGQINTFDKDKISLETVAETLGLLLLFLNS